MDVRNSDYSVVPTVTYKPSEFLQARVAYHYAVASQESVKSNKDHSLEFQFTFNLGAHPAHDF